jgi:hypothetical protein
MDRGCDWYEVRILFAARCPPQLLDRPPDHVAVFLTNLGKVADDQTKANHLGDEEENLRTLTIIREMG